MKKLTKIMLLVAAMAMVFAFASCGNDESKEQTDAADGDISIGIVQLVTHDALDSANKGFVDALADNDYVDGKNITIDQQNAQADQSNLTTIAQRFVNNDVDLILAIATGAAQAAAAETSDIPILGTAITDYEAARLVESNDAPGGNVSGTTDMNPIKEQVELIQQLVPDAKNVGIVYNSSEDNSVLQADEAKKALKDAGMTVKEGTVTSSNDVQQVITSIASKVDAVYLPTDNTLASSMAIVSEVAKAQKLPVICGESNMVMEGGLATLGIDYYKLGYQTGEMAVRILKGEADPAEMPIEAQTEFTYTINGETAEAIGITIPEELSQYVK